EIGLENDDVAVGFALDARRKSRRAAAGAACREHQGADDRCSCWIRSNDAHGSPPGERWSTTLAQGQDRYCTVERGASCHKSASEKPDGGAIGSSSTDGPDELARRSDPKRACEEVGRGLRFSICSSVRRSVPASLRGEHIRKVFVLSVEQVA